MIGIAGGSGSGKTTFSKLLMEKLGRNNVALLAQDSYDLDQSDKFDQDGGAVNFDHPEAIDWQLLAQHLTLLKKGVAVDMPIYDFATHKRKAQTIRIEPKKYAILDGILIFVPEEIRQSLDYKVFIDTSEKIRFERRLKRDVVERGRTPEGVNAQIQKQVKPMHDQFVEPSKEFADKKISGEKDFSPDIEELIKLLTL